MSACYAQRLTEFLDGTLDAATFSHRDHVGFAYELLLQQRFLDAVVTYSDSIHHIACKAGAEKKFNTTITLTFLSLIAERMQAKKYTSCETFLSDNQDLLSGVSLSKWYSKERLNSDLARAVFLMPDVA